MVGHGDLEPAEGNDALAALIGQAPDSNVNGDPAAPAAAPASVTITVEQFPGLCMGASILASLSLHKIGYDSLTEEEGKALTAALLKNAEAWDLGSMLQNPRAAAALDLVGCGVAILLPRILAEQKAKASPVQQAANDRAGDVATQAA
jgi:hypothetical protein